MDRRIRFGLIFVGPCPSTDGGFLRELCIKHIEGCSLNNRHYVLFTLERAKRSGDIIRAVEEQNRKNRTSDTELEEELLMASDGVLADGASTIVLMPVEDGNTGDKAMPSSVVAGGGGKPRGSSSAVSASNKRSPLVAVFDKGHAFQSHEIFRVISTAKLSHCQVRAPPAVDENGIPILDQQQSNQPTGYWSWTAAVQPDAARKRAISELTSDLVGNAINPASTKRISLPPSPAHHPVTRQPSSASVLLASESSLELKEDSVSEIENDLFRALEGNGEQPDLAAAAPSSAQACSSSCAPDETGDDGLMPEASGMSGGGNVPSLGGLSVEGKDAVAAEDDATNGGGGEGGDINDEEQVVWHWVYYYVPSHRSCDSILIS